MRLEIAVQDAALMHVMHRAGQRLHEAGRLAFGLRRIGGFGVEAATFDEFEGKERLPSCSPTS